MAPALEAEYTEVLNAARFNNGQSEHLLSYGGRQFRELLQLADPEIFRMFTFPFVQGQPDDAFGDPYVLVVSERVAAKIFEGEKAVGKVLTLNNKEEFRVVGVMKDIPHNSSIQFDVWAPLEVSNKWFRPGYTTTWTNMGFRSYVELTGGTDIKAFNEKIFNRIRRSNPNNNSDPVLYPYGKVYLESWGRLDTVRIFSLIALAILIIACANFMNLSTARSAHRAREVGLRKVVGARRQQVMGASVADIMALLSKEYAKWVLAANAIAWPVSYFLMKAWLQDYHYRIKLGRPVFLLAAAVSVTIAQLTVSFQALKAARTDPVRSLRYE